MRAKLILLTAGILLSGCAHQRATVEADANVDAPTVTAPTPTKVRAAKAPTVSPEARQLAERQKAAFVTELRFDKYSSDLREVAQDQLRQVLKNAADGRKISEFKIMSWSDGEYPSVAKQKLGNRSVRLADSRAQAIRGFLSKADREAKVTTYNMAQRPNVMGKFFKTKAATLKQEFEEIGAQNKAHEGSKAIVMVILKD